MSCPDGRIGLERLRSTLHGSQSVLRVKLERPELDHCASTSSIIMEVDGMASWMTNFLYKQANSTSMIISGSVQCTFIRFSCNSIQFYTVQNYSRHKGRQNRCVPRAVRPTSLSTWARGGDSCRELVAPGLGLELLHAEDQQQCLR